MPENQQKDINRILEKITNHDRFWHNLETKMRDLGENLKNSAGIFQVVLYFEPFHLRPETLVDILSTLGSNL